MGKFFLTVALFFGLSASSQAQFMVGGHLGPAFPLGEFSDVANLGFNLGADGKYRLNEHVAVGISLSWYSFKTRFEDLSENVTPFLFSVEYLIPQSAGFTPFVGLGLGPYRFTTRFDQLAYYETKFGIAPVAGALYALSDQLDLNANFKFNIVFTEDTLRVFVPLNVGILLKFPSKL